MLSEGYPKPFGNYALLEGFAHGGMGEVYLAKHGAIAGIDRLCVLKKLRPDLTQNEEYVNRFVDEARLVVQLAHANIAHVFDFGRAGEEYYLAMEYVSGVTMRAIQNRSIEKKTRIPEGIALFIMSEALEALDYAHRLKHAGTQQPLNLVHRDVSPQNVMVSFEGEVKLIDFGLAASSLKEEQTESQVVMGKVAYMAPEQARGDAVTASTDQFAMGICAYELLAEERFYNSKNNYEIWQVVGRGGFVPERWRSLNPELAGILARSLSGDVPNRFESCGDFNDALTAYRAKYHPLINKRTVRKYLAEIFAEDIARDQQRISTYANINVKDVNEGSSPRADTVSLVNPMIAAGLAPSELTEASSSNGGVFSVSDESALRKSDFIERDTVISQRAAEAKTVPSNQAVPIAQRDDQVIRPHEAFVPQTPNDTAPGGIDVLGSPLERESAQAAEVTPANESSEGLSMAFFNKANVESVSAEHTNVIKRSALENETKPSRSLLVYAMVAVIAVLIGFGIVLLLDSQSDKTRVAKSPNDKTSTPTEPSKNNGADPQKKIVVAPLKKDPVDALVKKDPVNAAVKKDPVDASTKKDVKVAVKNTGLSAKEKRALALAKKKAAAKKLAENNGDTNAASPPNNQTNTAIKKAIPSSQMKAARALKNKMKGCDVSCISTWQKVSVEQLAQDSKLRKSALSCASLCSN